ncbi:N-acetyltransferase [Kaistia sp. 32K]|uniref:GNAT family N-acetyltransferase n=1 Tax=Kaistia sp. 32K TaxID=2795690 RepID=UPI001915CDD3|nr:GNAT family N-acetyltransferase [Kaistia sp. 32K]BCP51527.1 N-acetyltransferase [Kaistia sp. 32K]
MASVLRKLDAAEARAAIPVLADMIVDAVANGASVNFLAGLTQADAAAFWQGQMDGIEAGGRVLVVAELDGRIVGTVVVTHAPQPNAPHRAEIGKMLVHSSARRRGFGRQLLAAAEAVAREAGKTLLHLDTQTGSAGEALYRATGWTEMGVMPDHALTPDRRLAATTFFYKAI